MINLQDRKDFLLDTGVSPGEDDSYDKQAQDLITREGSIVDNKKRNILDRVELFLQNARINEKPTGGPSPKEFIGQVLSKTIPTPSEVNPVNIAKTLYHLPGAVGQLASTVAKNPRAAVDYLASHPPAPSTLVSMLAPEATLAGYRNLVSLTARTYLHHMAGIPTPFTHVTEAERKTLALLGEEAINRVNDVQRKTMASNKRIATVQNEIRFAPQKELVGLADRLGLEVGIDIDNSTLNQVNKLRKDLLAQYNRRPMNKRHTIKNDHSYLLGEAADNENVRLDYKELTGKNLPGFMIRPENATHSYSSALGKTYLEPMIDKTTGRVVPKAIHDTYKFYPDVYGYRKGEALRLTKARVNAYLESLSSNSKWDNFTKIPNTIKVLSQDIFNLNSGYPLGVLARKVAFGRPTTIVNIPLRGKAPMNAYDKAAILLGATPLTRQGK